MNWQERTKLLLGNSHLSNLVKANILVVGVGGVGGYAAEMLCRAGIGNLTLVDADIVSETNINRQLPALHSTIGRPKVEVLKERFLDINPDLNINTRQIFVEANEVKALFIQNYDFVVDAIDTIQCKCKLIEYCLDNNIPIISAMGAGAKTDLSKIQITNIWKTHHCRLSKTVRDVLTHDGYKSKKLPVVFSDEQPNLKAVIEVQGEKNKRSTVGSIGYYTAVFGCYMAEYVIKNLTKEE